MRVDFIAKKHKPAEKSTPRGLGKYHRHNANATVYSHEYA